MRLVIELSFALATLALLCACGTVTGAPTPSSSECNTSDQHARCRNTTIFVFDTLCNVSYTDLVESIAELAHVSENSLHQQGNSTRCHRMTATPPSHGGENITFMGKTYTLIAEDPAKVRTINSKDHLALLLRPKGIISMRIEIESTTITPAPTKADSQDDDDDDDTKRIWPEALLISSIFVLAVVGLSVRRYYDKKQRRRMNGEGVKFQQRSGNNVCNRSVLQEALLRDEVDGNNAESEGEAGGLTTTTTTVVAIPTGDEKTTQILKPQSGIIIAPTTPHKQKRRNTLPTISSSGMLFTDSPARGSMEELTVLHAPQPTGAHTQPEDEHNIISAANPAQQFDHLHHAPSATRSRSVTGFGSPAAPFATDSQGNHNPSETMFLRPTDVHTAEDSSTAPYLVVSNASISSPPSGFHNARPSSRNTTSATTASSPSPPPQRARTVSPKNNVSVSPPAQSGGSGGEADGHSQQPSSSPVNNNTSFASRRSVENGSSSSPVPTVDNLYGSFVLRPNEVEDL